MSLIFYPGGASVPSGEFLSLLQQVKKINRSSPGQSKDLLLNSEIRQCRQRYYCRQSPCYSLFTAETAGLPPSARLSCRAASFTLSTTLASCSSVICWTGPVRLSAAIALPLL